MFNKFLMAATVAGGLIATSSVSAANISFDRTELLTDGTLNFSGGSTSVDVSGVLVDSSGFVTGSASISSYASTGIGVCSSGPCINGTNASVFLDKMVDGAGAFEALLLDFGTTSVRLTGVSFTYVDSVAGDKDDLVSVFNMGNGAGSAPTASSIGNALPDGSWTASVSLPDIGVGSLFSIAALEATSDYKVSGISFDIVPRIQRLDIVAPVPLPAGGLLLLGALGGLAVVRRRKG